MPILPDETGLGAGQARQQDEQGKMVRSRHAHEDGILLEEDAMGLSGRGAGRTNAVCHKY